MSVSRPQYALDVTWLSTMPELHALLHGDPPARVADMACTAGWFSIGLARAYPKVYVDGFDRDGQAIDRAWRHAHASGLTDRITFHQRDVSAATLNGRYDLCVAHGGLGKVHHLRGVLRTMRRLLDRTSAALIVEPMPDLITGITPFAEQVQRHAEDVGFAAIEWLPLPGYALRVYRLYP